MEVSPPGAQHMMWSGVLGPLSNDFCLHTVILPFRWCLFLPTGLHMSVIYIDHPIYLPHEERMAFRVSVSFQDLAEEEKLRLVSGRWLEAVGLRNLAEMFCLADLFGPDSMGHLMRCSLGIPLDK